MHHILDVSYNEDMCRLYSKKAQENMNILRKIGVGIHKNYLKGEYRKSCVNKSFRDKI